MTNATELSHEEQHLADFRQAKDAFMREDHHSPLSHEQQHAFQGLSYFPFNPDLILELPLDKDVPGDVVTMETSAGEQQEYHRAGKVHFDVDGQPATLTIYQGEDEELFLPLRDATSGQESYGAGRYLEPELEENGTVFLDFNYLYNPYCAYNDAFSCPLPPLENWLQVPIRAGEKKFHE